MGTIEDLALPATRMHLIRILCVRADRRAVVQVCGVGGKPAYWSSGCLPGRWQSLLSVDIFYYGCDPKRMPTSTTENQIIGSPTPQMQIAIVRLQHRKDFFNLLKPNVRESFL